MPTNEERREVSKKIRELTEDVWSLAKEWEDQADYYQIHFAIFFSFPADHMHPCDYNELHERLADLIEPEPERTGHAVEDVSIGGYVSWRCSECGQPINKADNYCSNCGVRLVAKVVE